MTTQGKYCDFDFYVASFDADNRYADTEPMSSGLSLLEAVSEFYKRCGRYPSSTNIMLGVEYTTSRRDLEPTGKGAADLLQRVNGALTISRDFEQSEVLKRDGLIANNAVSFLKQQSENLYELSDKYTIECARKIAESLSQISRETLIKSNSPRSNECTHAAEFDTLRFNQRIPGSTTSLFPMRKPVETVCRTG